MAVQAVLEIRNNSKNYIMGKTIIPALRNINLKICEGDFLVIAGPSGSGKTTLLNIIGLIDKPTSGEIWIQNENITSRSLNSLFKYRRDRLGYIFQNFNLIPVLNVYENVEYPLILNTTSWRRRRELVEKALLRVGLFDRKKHKPNELSGGERQRVSIARAVVKNPRIVLADEPTASLDSKTGVSIVELMERLNQEEGVTFVFSSHDPLIIAKGKRVVHLKDGEIQKAISQERVS